MNRIIYLHEFKKDRYYVFIKNNFQKIYKCTAIAKMHNTVALKDLVTHESIAIYQGYTLEYEIFEISKEENPEYFL